MDLSKLSNAELDALEAGDLSKLSKESLMALDASPPVPEGPSTLEAFGRGAAQGVTLGFADEITGGVEALGDVVSGAKGAQDFIDLYRQHRDESRANYEAANKAHPYAYFGGQLGGGLATAPLLGGVGAGVKGAALIGGVAGLGASKADLTQGDIGGAALDTALGAGTGAALGAVAQKVFNPRQTARELTIAHLRPTQAVRTNLGESGLNRVADEVLDSGVMGFGSKVNATAGNLENAVSEVGQVIGDIREGATRKIPMREIIREVKEQAIEPRMGTAEEQPLIDLIKQKISGLKSQYGANASLLPAETEAEKTAVNANINWKIDPSSRISALRDYSRALKNVGERYISDPAFPAAKQSYGNLSEALGMASRTGGLQNGGLLSHITDTGMNTAAIESLLHGANPVGAGALMLGRGLTKGRMSSAGAVVFNKLAGLEPYGIPGAGNALKNAGANWIGSKSAIAGGNTFQPVNQNLNVMNSAKGSPFESVLQSAAQNGEDSVAVAHYILQQSYPEYQELFDE